MNFLATVLEDEEKDLHFEYFHYLMNILVLDVPDTWDSARNLYNTLVRYVY